MSNVELKSLFKKKKNPLNFPAQSPIFFTLHNLIPFNCYNACEHLWINNTFFNIDSMTSARYHIINLIVYSSKRLSIKSKITTFKLPVLFLHVHLQIRMNIFLTWEIYSKSWKQLTNNRKYKSLRCTQLPWKIVSKTF